MYERGFADYHIPCIMEKFDNGFSGVVFTVKDLYGEDCSKLTDLFLDCGSTEKCIECVKYLVAKKSPIEKMSINNRDYTIVGNNPPFDLMLLEPFYLTKLTIFGGEYVGLDKLLENSEIRSLEIVTDGVHTNPGVNTTRLLKFRTPCRTPYEHLRDLCERNKLLVRGDTKSARAIA